MPICPECNSDFIPCVYASVCDCCGYQIEYQYTQLQEFKRPQLTMMELSSRAVWGECAPVGPVWRIG